MTAALTSTPLPPGPGSSKWWNAAKFIITRDASVPRWHDKYGHTFSLTLPMRMGTLVFITRPEDIRATFAGNPKDFHAGEGNAVLRPVMGKHSVLLIDEDAHMRARKLLMPAFSNRAVRGYESLVQSIAHDLVSSWAPDNGASDIRPLDQMNALTLEVILRVVFGVTDEDRLDDMRPMVNKTVNFPSWMLIGFAQPRLHQVGPWRRYFENQHRLSALLYQQIAEHRADTDLEARDDVLSRLIRVGSDGDEPLSDEELRDQLITLLLAGHETTASALSWTMHELARHPDIQDEARQAAHNDDGDFLEACMKEAMRLHPVIDQVARFLTTPQEVAGYRLPRGVTVAPSVRIVQHNEELHPAAMEYRPRRFIDTRVEPNSWIPFGGGVRRCIGAGFSVMEGRVILREILTRYRIEPLGKVVEKRRNISGIPDPKARLKLTPISSH